MMQVVSDGHIFAAQVYANELLQGRRFKLLLDKAGAEFKELIFNATEFRIGNSFRFRASWNPRAVIGNNDFRIERGVAEQIRLADIVAASSCFPSAFEPIRFPDDFVWDDLGAVRNELLFVYLIPFLLALAVAGGLVWLKRLVNGLRRIEVAGSVFDVWEVVQALTVPDLLEMLKAGFGSLTKMT